MNIFNAAAPVTEISSLAALVTEISVLAATVTAVIATCKLLIRGVRCLMRSQMLETYYHNVENETIRQYELENFLKLYEAYKALRGNSFIDDICKTVRTWKVIT